MRLVLWVVVTVAIAVLTAALSLRWFSSRDRAHIDEVRNRLLAATAPERPAFDPALLSGVPPVARRYLEHAIAAGTAWPAAVDLALHGEVLLRDDDWAALTGDHVIATGFGYCWRVTMELDGHELSGAEYYVDRAAHARFWRDGFRPSSQDGSDLNRSARERFGVERIFLPFALLPQAGVEWRDIDGARTSATFEVDGESLTLVLRVGDDGSLLSVKTRRWGNLTEDHAYTALPFGVRVLEEHTFDGVTIPTRLSYRWWDGTEREREYLRPVVILATFHGGG